MLRPIQFAEKRKEQADCDPLARCAKMNQHPLNLMINEQ
jgi:hypothetical protein